MNCSMWWLSINHLDSRDPKRPDISFEVITSLLNDFWRHPERGTNEGVALGFDIGKLRSYTKVREFNFPRGR